MSSLLSFLLVYLLGGLSFLPLLLALVFLFAYYTFPEIALEDPVPVLRRETDDESVFKTGDEKLLRKLNKAKNNTGDVAAGYFAVTREFVPGGVNGKPPERMSPVGNVTTGNGSPSMYQSVYRTLFDRRGNATSAEGSGEKKAGRRARNEFFVILRHGHLMLYDDSEQSEVRHVVSLSLYKVSIYGGGEEIPEGELYIRRNAICLSRNNTTVDPALNGISAAMPFFLFSENCSQKEDFYFALLKSQEKSLVDPAIPPKPIRYEQKHMISLVQQLHSSEEQLQTNWMNGLMGRLFLAIYKTPDIETFFRTRITKKIARVNKPNFLSDIVLQKIDVGETIPYITNPRLKELTADGEFCAEADVSYSGNFRLEIAAKATINLGARFKPREVNLVLAVVFKKLEGHGLIRIKAPPSNRLWISFEKMPKMELSVEPIVGSRQIAWAIVHRAIEARIREVMAETIVLPHYDDIPFTNTFEQRFRGGIWEEGAAERRERQKNESAAERGSVNGVEKEYASEENSAGRESPGAEINPRAMSMPMLSQPLSELDKKKAASTIGLSEAIENGRTGTSRTPSVKTTRSPGNEKNPKVQRTHSFTSVAPPSPVVSTDAINVTAVHSPETGDAASSALEHSRNKSSNPQSPVETPTGSLSKAKSGSFNTELLEISSEQLSGSSPSSTYSDADDRADEVVPRTPTGAYGTSSLHHQNDSASTIVSSNGSTSKSINTKNSLGAIVSATSAVRQWYKARNQPFDEGSSSSSSTNTTRNMAPAEIPPPPTKRTAPINVPQRKSLPPPALPARRSSRAIPGPPLPPRTNNEIFGGGGGGGDELLVVAAPPEPSSSEPNTPREDDEEFLQGGDYLGNGSWTSRGSSSAEPDVVLENTSESGSGISRKEGSSIKGTAASGESTSWERKRMRERAEEESEEWHAAEEAEMRAKVPWEPDEA